MVAGDGYTVMKRLLMVPATALIPVIVVTARDSSEEKALAAGARAHIQKPVDYSALLETIESVLGLQSA